MASSDRYPDAKDDLRTAISSALQAAEETADEMQAFDRAGELAKVLRDGVSAAARLRSRMARRVQEAGNLSVRHLADKLQVKKSTAQQILRFAPPRSSPRASPRRRPRGEAGSRDSGPRTDSR